MKFAIASSALLVAGVSADSRADYGDLVGADWHCDKFAFWNNRCGDAHLFNLGDYLACDSYQVQASDLDGSCGHADKPCITAYIGIPNYLSPECGKCFRATFYEDGLPHLSDGVIDDISANCKNPEGCGAYEQVVYLKAMDETRAANFEVSHDAWNVFCPYVCAHSSICVRDPEVCVWGTWPVDQNWLASYKPVTYEEVPCGESGGDGPASPTTTTTRAPVTTVPTPPPTPAPTPAPPTPTTTQGAPALTTAPTAPTPAPTLPPTQAPPSGGPRGACVQELDCDVSAWCEADYQQYCFNENAHDSSHCPAPHCKWARRSLRSIGKKA